MKTIATRTAYTLIILALSSIAVFYAIRLSGGDAIAARLGIGNPARGLCDHQTGAARQAAFGWSLLSARTPVGATGSVDLEEFIHQFLVEVISSFSFLSHFNAITQGVIDMRDFIYFASLIAFWLFANVILIEIKKAD